MAEKALKFQDAPYGHPHALVDKDKEWFRELFESLWSSSQSMRGWLWGGRLTQRQIDKVIRLTKQHVLPCVMGSGPYGDLSVHLYDHVDVPVVEPEILFGFHETHLGWGGTFDLRFAELSKLTHTPENENICKFYNLPAPKPKCRYSY